MEKELQELRTQLETTQRKCSEVEERAKQEINTKLQQVNNFLQTQAASQKALDQINESNYTSLHSRMEQRIRDLMGQLSQAQINQQNSQIQLDKYKSMYSEERNLRQTLTEELQRVNDRRYKTLFSSRTGPY
ncbi:hypothetical protein WMY93_021762 [Mugilogobius chulae]|uniref:DUF3496 domain-containing protein n=1 Tax=Mugilogobius chulae TaxID=88201 RepID=A0AAW0NBL2_9GOBI